jgi:RHS repeat-associated protein
MQEHHYYPYGLQIAAISSRSYGKLDNYFRYQGAYSQFEEETGWTNFDLRSYDAQLGRWTGIDPYDQFASGYMGMGGNPVNGIDPDGGTYYGINWLNVAGNTFTNWEIIGSRVINTLSSAVVGGLINSAANGWNWRNFGQGAAWGGVAGLAATYIPWGDVGSAIGSAAGWTWNNLGNFFQAVEVNSVKFAIYQDKEDYDRVKNGYKQGKWLFIGARTIQDALAKVPTKYKKKSFKNLIISSHGKAGVSNIMKEGAMGNVVLEAAFKGDLQKAPENAHYVDAVNALAEVLDYLKDGGNCFFTGCNSGSGTVGESYGKNLVSLGGCRFDLYMNQDQGADAFQEDASGKPTGRTMLHDRNGSFNSTYNDGWRKFSIGENGAVKMENLQKKKGGKVIKKGVVFLDYNGELVFP